MGPAALAAFQGGINASNSALGNLWASKERRIQTAWVNRQYDKELMNNREDATLAWQRQNDYEYQMSQMKKAGINPYLVAGNTYNAPVSQGVRASSTPQQAQFHSPQIGNILTEAMQMKLIQAQATNLNADTQLKNENARGQAIQNELNQSYGWLDREVGWETAKQGLVNMKSTQLNIEATTSLINQQKVSEEAKSAVLSIQAMYENQKQQLSIKASKSQIDYTLKNIKVLDAQISKLKAEVTATYTGMALTAQQIKESNARIRKILAETATEDELRDSKKGANERSGYGPIGGPIKGFTKEITDGIGEMIKRIR